LKNHGIESRPYFYPISEFPMYSKANTPVTHRVYQKGTILPSYEELSHSDIDFVCNSIKSILGYEQSLGTHPAIY
jgi:perosamine synthetase